MTRHRWPRFQASRNAGLVRTSSQRALWVEYLILSSFAQRGMRPHFVIFATRLPSTERTATSMWAVGGLFQSGS
jgi:hypothetical protein